MGKSRVLAVTGVVVGALVALTGCSSSFQGVECTFDLHNVHESTGSPGYIDAKATGSCTSNATAASVTVGIQKLVNGTWVYVANSNATRPIKPVVGGKTYTAMSSKSIKCTPGTYRSTGTGTLTVGSTTSPAYQLGYGKSVYIDCK